MNAPPNELRERILAATRATPSPTRSERRTGTTIAGAAAAVICVVLSWVCGLPSTRSPGVLAALAVGGVAWGLAISLAAASRGRSMLGRSRGTLAATVVLAPLGVLAWATLVTFFEGRVVVAGGTAAQHAACTAFTLLFALAPSLAFTYVRRGSDPVHPRLLGAALGAAAGAWAGGMIDVHCKVTTVEHMALGHALPVVFVAVVGALVGARAFGVRPTTARGG